MATRVKLGVGEYVWQCDVCRTQYEREKWALKCEEGHDTVFIKMRREDLFKLLNFIMTKDDSLLSESLIKTLQKYTRGTFL